MNLLAGVNHVAVVTADLDRFVEDLGAFHSVWFHDPDGMRAELTVIVDDALAGIHAPRPLATR